MLELVFSSSFYLSASCFCFMQHMVKTCEVCGHEPMTHMSIYQRIHLLVKVMLNVIPWWWLSPSKSPKIVVQSEVLSSGKINPYPKCVCIPGEDKALYPQWWDGLNIINWLPNDWEDLWGMCHTGAPQLYLLCDTGWGSTSELPWRPSGSPHLF